MTENNEWRGIVKSGGLSPETEKLLAKYLKLQIAKIYWSAVSRIIIILLIIGSAVFSTMKLAPFLDRQLKLFESMQPVLNNVSGVALPISD